MNRAEFDDLSLARWRRPLTPAELQRLEARFALHPEDREEWESDTQLQGLMRQLPERMPSSNFTAQVLAAVQPARSRPTRSPVAGWRSLLLNWRMATTLAAAVVLVAGLNRFQSARRGQLAQNAATLSTLTLPSVEMLQDFDAIYSMSQSAPPATADVELLLALQ